MVPWLEIVLLLVMLSKLSEQTKTQPTLAFALRRRQVLWIFETECAVQLPGLHRCFLLLPVISEIMELQQNCKQASKNKKIHLTVSNIKALYCKLQNPPACISFPQLLIMSPTATLSTAVMF